MKKVVLTLIFLSFTVTSFAAERETLKEKCVGFFVKTFAKTYVATNSLTKFKEKNIKKIKKMDEAKFQRVYGKIYREIMVDLPQDLKEKYGITEDMTRDKAIAQINSFNSKKKIYRLINSVPNKMIAKHFKQHKAEFDKTLKKQQSTDQLIDQLLEDPTAQASQSL